MTELRLDRIHERAAWNASVTRLPGCDLLQSWEWGTFKERYGWRPKRLAWSDAGHTIVAAAQVLERTLRTPVLSGRARVHYCSRGPLLDWSHDRRRSQILSDLLAQADRQHAIFLKIDPALPLASGLPEEAELAPIGQRVARELRAAGWRESEEQIQFRNTLRIDLERDEDELLGAMKQKTRYNIRLAARRGVKIRSATAEDLPLLYRMYAETSARDGFAIRNPAYYRDVWGTFTEAGLAQPFLAEVEGEPVAGLVVYRFGRTAWYLYGMSRSAHRDKMPNHLLQWEAIRWAKDQGCTTYDFWGAPDRFDPADPMWGVYRFKRGFGATTIQMLGAWDYPLQPRLYRLYTSLLPRALAILRALGRRQVQRSLAPQ